MPIASGRRWSLRRSGIGKWAVNGLVERALASTRELDDFPRELSPGSLLLNLIDLRPIHQLLVDVSIWRVESAQAQFGGKIVHSSFVRPTFSSKPSSDCENPFGVQPSDIEVGEATPANQVILPPLHALVL